MGSARPSARTRGGRGRDVAIFGPCSIGHGRCCVLSSMAGAFDLRPVRCRRRPRSCTSPRARRGQHHLRTTIDDTLGDEVQFVVRRGRDPTTKCPSVRFDGDVLRQHQRAAQAQAARAAARASDLAAATARRHPARSASTFFAPSSSSSSDASVAAARPGPGPTGPPRRRQAEHQDGLMSRHLTCSTTATGSRATWYIDSLADVSLSLGDAAEARGAARGAAPRRRCHGSASC